MPAAKSADPAEHRIDRPRSLVDLAVERIREAIIDGRLGFGEQVSEVGLATTFGVSKTPVREALLRLRLEGLVEIHPQRGSFVFALTEQQVAELTRFRELIESAALGEAMAGDREALRARMAANLEEMARCEAAGESDRLPALDTDFHASILETCGNPYLRSAYDLIAYKIQALRSRLPVQSRKVDDCQHSHAAILEAVEGRATARAQKLLREHIRNTESAYLGASRNTRAAA
ncbi:MAG: GntR family transcriptional regulator [Rhodocyclaceae bacterium]|nr:GntR family transcriptional regulator [Rhodocyclaceae bacterium]